ncbi:MAG: DUF1501 domain-containing protein [Gemmataceae bacterium]|nr:DUF1501 domain-containing protein [Gemmataceae bacterium]
MFPSSHPALLHARRHFFGKAASGVGMAALASLLAEKGHAAPDANGRTGTLRTLHHPAKAKRVIYLFMSGGPSHIELFDYKPALRRHHGEELPATIRMGQRVTGMTSGQRSFPCVYPMFGFQPHGQSGTHISNLLPYTARIVDDITIVKSLHTEAINHDPAITFIQTGSQQPGRPSFGAWLSYGLGCETSSLPAFVVMVSQGSGNKTDQPIFSRLWGAGFLPSEHQGVRFRTGADPVLYLSNPPGVDGETRRTMLDATRQLNELSSQTQGDPEIDARIAQYELAFRMQSAVPELTDLSREPKQILDMYGVNRTHDDGGFARNCLLARRMVERGVRFVQLMHRGWDQHGGLPGQIRGQCMDVDQPAAALVMDLKQRGLLEDTLVIFGGEFGRTVYSQGALTANNYGRDHHGRCFSMWVAGGGFKPGASYGETDDFCYNIVRDPVHIHDFNATLMHCLGIDHERLTFRFQGRDYRLTDVHGEVVPGLLA